MILDLAALCTIILVFTLALVFQDVNLVIVQLTFFLSLWTILVMNCFSMRYIQRELKEVEGILADVKFMALYVGLFFCAALSDTIGITLQLFEQQEGSVIYCRVRITTAVLAMMMSVFFFCIHMLMLAMFVKFANANKLPSHVKNRLTRSLHVTLSKQGSQQPVASKESSVIHSISSSAADENALGQDSKQAFQRRMRVYREIVEQQISSILASMLTVSNPAL